MAHSEKPPESEGHPQMLLLLLILWIRLAQVQ
jgi:hypothetical protein